MVRLRRLAKTAVQPHLDRPERTLVVTGIPRSGTSLFSALINRIHGIVCFNEIFYDVDTLPYDIARTRRRLVTGAPVPNKYDSAGRLATDTMDGAEVRYVALPKQPRDVVVATNVNVPYLFSMQRLLELGCPIIALVRDPVFTIASWGSARAAAIPEAHLGPPERDIHPRWQHLNFAGATAIERRAELWNHLAAMIAQFRHTIRVVRYEDLVRDPGRELTRLARQFDLEGPGNVDELRNRNENLRFNDLESIRHAVARFAPMRASFGYGDS